MGAWIVSSLLATASHYLAQRGVSSARLDAELLLAEVLHVDRMALYTDRDRPLTPAEVDAFRSLVRRRSHHEPVAYILGRAHFRYQQLLVTPAVLIPRPETEELVDQAFAWLDTHPLEVAEAAVPARTGAGGVEGALPLVADVGVGSGAIALSLAGERGLRVLGLDLSPEALAVARENRAGLGLEAQVELREGDLLQGIPDGSLRLVLSNPPYIDDAGMRALAPDVSDYEPQAALRGGADGLDVIRRLLAQALRALSPGGRLLLEVAADQAEAVVALGLQAGFCLGEVFTDLSGKQRMVGLSRPGAPVRSLSEAGAERARGALRRALGAGAICGLPTDTVYGLACAWDSGRGVRRLFSTKGRGQAKPLAVIFASVAEMRASLPDLPAAVLKILDDLLPGPLTFVVPTAVPRPGLVGTADSLGVRVPAERDLLSFLTGLGVPLAATSANRSGEPDAAGADMVPGDLAAACAVLLTAGEGIRAGGVASTVVDLRTLAHDGRWRILREGALAADALAKRMGRLGH